MLAELLLKQGMVIGRVSAGDSDLWEGVVIKIPSVPPTNLAGVCNVIKVYYTLELNVVPNGLAFN